MAQKRKLTQNADDDDLLGFINTAAIDDMLEGIDSEIPPYRGGDKIEFVHAGGKFKGSVLKVLEDGLIKVADKAGNVFKITTEDVIRDGETASQLIARKKGLKRPVYESHQLEETNKKITKVAKEAAAPVKKKSSGGKTQRELVEELAEKGERDYDVIAEKTGVTRVNVGQYMYRWKKANPKKA